MSTAFTRALRVIHADGGRPALAAAGAAIVILAGWAVWAEFAHVTLYEVSANARLEVNQAAYPVQAPMLGRVVRADLMVGRQVRAGDVLVELESSDERLQGAEQRARLDALGPQIAALRSQISAEEATIAQERRASQVAVEEALANAKQSEVPAQHNAQEEQRLRRLRDEKLISERDYQQALANSQQSKLAAERDNVVVRRIEQEQRTREGDRLARIRSLETNIASLEAQASAIRATIQRLRNEVERRTIRAPFDGRIGEAALLRTGSVVDEGDRVASIVPEGHVVVVAQFPPPAAFGRLAPGQHAEMRLDGFPWMQYGSLQAVVQRVGGEVRDGTVRVELAINNAPPGIPMQHGLPGSVEVAVERVTPATLLLRNAGALWASPRSAYLK